MKRLILIIVISLLLLQMIVLAAVITMGNEAINRDSGGGSGNTWVDRLNPADGAGTITTVEIWAKTTIQGCEVATFSAVGNDLTTRDTQSIGNVLSGSKRTFVVDLDVEVGDYIGLKITLGDAIEASSGGGNSIWAKFGDFIPCAAETFDIQDWGAISIKGIGATVSVGWDGPFNDATITKWNTMEITKWNTIE